MIYSSNPQVMLRSAVRSFRVQASPLAHRAQSTRGAQKLDETSQNSLEVEEFLAGLRFEKRGKLEELTIRK
jgi:hypothetical protein